MKHDIGDLFVFLTFHVKTWTIVLPGQGGSPLLDYLLRAASATTIDKMSPCTSPRIQEAIAGRLSTFEVFCTTGTINIVIMGSEYDWTLISNLCKCIRFMDM